MAVAALVTGIVGLLCCGFVTGIPAVILGMMSRKKIAESGGRLSGDGMALAGIITGAIAIVWGVIVGIIWIISLAASSSSGY